MAVNDRTRGAGRPRKGTPGVDLRTIVEKAWEIVDAHGVDKLSTRALAAALNIRSPTLYWHIKNKDELLSLMIENLLHDSLGESAAAGDWREWLRQIGQRQRDLFLSHRDSSIIASIARPTQKLQTELFPKMLAPLIAAGFSARQASSAIGALASMVLGWVLYEQRSETRQFVEAFHAPGEGFDFALDALVQGIARKIQVPASG